MTRRPYDAPLGGKPVLPAPTAPATTSEHAAQIFARLRAREASTRMAAANEPPPSQPVPTPKRSARRYDLALMVAGVGAEDISDEPTRLTQPDLGHAEETLTAVVPAPSRPPWGAAQIRPGARRRPDEAAGLDQSALETVADGILIESASDGTLSFDVSIRDDVFDDLSCRITVRAGRVEATFRATDGNTRRLIESEAGRLRARLEERGFMVDAVSVIDASRPSAG